MVKIKEKDALVSVIVPVFNNEKYILDCIQSICRQSYQNLEIIIINDGSTDRSLELLDMCAKKDNRIRLFTIQNSGVSVARNTGMNYAEGKYISFVDSDDTIQNDMVECLVNAIESGDYGMAISGIEMCYYKKNSVKRINNLSGIQCVKNKEDFEKTFSRLYQCKAYLSPWAKLYRRSIINRQGIRFRENISLGEDMLFNYDYFRQNCTSIIVNEALYSYRIEKKDSLTQNYTAQRLFNNEVLLRESVDFMEEWGCPSMFEPIAKYYFVSSLLVIQGYFGNRNERRKIIQHMLAAEATKYACGKKQTHDLELKLYQKIFDRKKTHWICAAAYARYFVKKILR